MSKYIDITGQRFGRITVVSFCGIDKNRAATFNCLCDCGTKTVVFGSNLRSGLTTSCGCYHREVLKLSVLTRTKHGKRGTGAYSSWHGMIQRCSNPNVKAYKDYGGRGITVCDKWKSFEGFYEDMGERPPKTTIERIDTNKGYTVDNCIWANSMVQANNTRSNKFVEYNGKVQTIAQWAAEYNLSYMTLHGRLFKSQWSIEDCLNVKPSRFNSNLFGKNPVKLVKNPDMSLIYCEL